MWDPYAEFQTATLPNGLTVHAALWPGRPWEAMGFLVHSGAEHDPVGLEGVAHFIEHMVSQNTNATRKDVTGFFEDCGGMVSLGSTGYPDTRYRFFVPADKTILARAFSLFGNMLLSAKLEKFIERERQVIVGEFHRRYSVKFMLDVAWRERKAMYAGYWLERFVMPLGTPESVARITQSDMQAQYDEHYTPANISIVGVGGMALSELVELLSDSPFAAFKKGVRTPVPTPASDVGLPSETRHVLEMSKHITLPVEVGSYRSVAKIPCNMNARVIQVMAEMFDEVLNEEVRERLAWAYAINSSGHNFRHFHEVAIDCAALALQGLSQIEEVVEVCIVSMSDREDLFTHAKRRALASNLMIDSTGKGICNGALNDLGDDQRITSLAEYGKDIERVTMGDVRDLLHWLRPERRWTVITKP
jgi:predicted Zn-dependent peptidase